MRTRYFFCITVLIFASMNSSVVAQTESSNGDHKSSRFWSQNVRVQLVSRMYTAFEFGDNKFQVAKLTMTPEVKIKIRNDLHFTTIARFYGELLDNLEPGQPSQDAVSEASRRLLLGDRFELELREFYFDWYAGNRTTFRFGKQQVVWGETDGIKLLDVVNPHNFREFILEEFEDARIPLWSIKAQFPISIIDAELIWVPDLSYHDIPGFNAPFFPHALIPQLPEGVEGETLSTDKPDHFIVDSDVGLKLSKFIGGWDVSVNYLFHYDDMPVLKRSSAGAPGGGASLAVQPVYNRMHTVGGTFNNAIGPVTLRGEVAFNIGKRLMTSSMEDPDGIVKTDQFQAATGIDWAFGETLLSLQVFHDLLLTPVPAFNRKRYESNVSLLANHQMLNDQLTLEFLLVQNLNRGDGMIRPKASYYLTSNTQLSAGADIFYGSSTGLFGQFNNRSRVFFGIEIGI